MKKLLMLLGVAVMSSGAMAFITDYDTSGCRAGRITTDITSAKAYAKKNGKFILMIFSKTGGCGFCKNAAESIWNTADFRNWAKANDIPVVLADCTEAKSAAYRQFVDLYYEGTISVPVLVLIDGADGKAKFGWDIIHGATFANGNVGRDFTMNKNGVYINPFDYQTISDIVRFYLNKSDNVVSGSAARPNDYRPRARAITPDAASAKTLTVNGLWGTWENNDLSCTLLKTGGGTIVGKSDDNIDWYQFSNAKAGTSYVLKTPYLKDSLGIGYVGVYTNSTTAKAATSYSKAKKNAAKWIKMSDLKNGVSFVAPKAGTVYLAFTRRDANDKEAITLKYTFTLQAGTTSAYEFDAATYSFDEYATDAALTIKRLNSDTAETATVTVKDGTAVAGKDFKVASTTVSFAKGEKTARLPIQLLAEKKVYTGDRKFTVTIAKDGKDGGVTTTTVTIKESDFATTDVVAEADATELGAKTEKRLNYTNTVTWHKISGTAGKIYTLSAKNVVVRNVTKANISVYRNTTSELVGTSDTTKTNPLVFGSDADDTYLVKVERAAGTQPVTCVYELAVATSTMPTVGFAKTALNVDPPKPDATADLAVTATGATTGITVGWKTADGTAKAGLDYEAVRSGTVSVGATEGALSVVLKTVEKWSAERKFTVSLLPADFKTMFYMLDKTAAKATVTIAADAKGNDIPALSVDCGELPSDGTWKGVDDDLRNVSADTFVDRITLTNVKNSQADEQGVVTNAVLYRLRCGELDLRPSAADVRVQVMANGTAIAGYDWSLSSLTNAWPALYFTGLADEKVELVVTNRADASVLASYKLELAAWGNSQDEADPQDDTPEGVVGTALTEMPTVVARRLACEDKCDAFRFTGLAAGDWCLVDLASEKSDWVNLKTSAVSVEVTMPGESPVKTTYAKFGDGTHRKLFKASSAGEVLVRVLRAETSVSTQAKPVVLDYVLTAQKYLWPKIGFTTATETVTNLTAGTSVNLTLERKVNTAVETAVTVWTTSAASSTDLFTAISNAVVFAAGEAQKEVVVNLPAPDGRGTGTFTVNLAVDESTTAYGENKSVTVSVSERPWPVVTFAAGQPTQVKNDQSAVELKIVRNGDYLEKTAPFRLKLTDSNSPRVTVGSSRNLSFAAGVSELVEKVTLVQGAAGFWSRGGSFTVELVASTSEPNAKVTIGDAKSLTIAVADRNALPENDCPADDTREGAPSYEFNPILQTATKNMAEGQSVAWLNGSDTSDWYRFTGLDPKRSYAFGVQEFSQTNATGLASLEAKFYVGQTLIAKQSLAELAKAPIKVSPATTGDLYVLVTRSEKSDASVRYALTYRILEGYVQFRKVNVSVSEAKSAVNVDVVWNATIGDEVAFTVTPRDGTATSPSDYDATPIVRSFIAKSTNGTETVEIPLTNADKAWEGNEVFYLDLTSQASNVKVGLNATATITIKEADPPQYGQVQITHAGNDLTKVSQVGELKVREGRTVKFKLRRTKGVTGAIDGKWLWTDADGHTVKTVSTRGIFNELEDGYAQVEVPVPEKEGFQKSQKWTVKFALLSTCAAKIVSKTPVSFVCKVTDANYEGKIATYSADDPTRIPFAAESTDWFVGPSDSICSSTPKEGASVILSASVTGAGCMMMDVAFAHVTKSTLKYRIDGGSAKSLKEGSRAIAIDAGKHVVEIIFKRSSSDPDTASVTLSNIVFEQAEDFNAYGTFVGAVEADFGAGVVRGSGKVTTTASGRLSGKFVLNGKTYSFSSSKVWSEETSWACVVTPSSADQPVTLTVDPLTGAVQVATEDGAVSGMLLRTPWTDRPMTEEAADALGEAIGSYTVNLTGNAGEDYDGARLKVEVSSTGSVKAAGNLVDEDRTPVSASGTLTVQKEEEKVVSSVILVVSKAVIEIKFADGSAKLVSCMSTAE